MTETWTGEHTSGPGDGEAVEDLDPLLDDLDLNTDDNSDNDIDDDPDDDNGVSETDGFASSDDFDDPLGLNDDDDAVEGATSLSYFEGDTGRLDYEQRRVLHAVLKHRYISADRHPDQWANLLLNEELIRSRLNELFLDLHVDVNYRVAFKRQAVAETGASLPTLLHEVAHTKEETIMLVALRHRFFQQRQDGDTVVFVDRAGLLDEVAGMRPEHATDRAFDQKKSERAVEGLRKAGVLLKTRDPDRFRISPVIEVLLPIQKLRELMTWLMTQNGTTEHPDGPDSDGSDVGPAVEHPGASRVDYLFADDPANDPTDGSTDDLPDGLTDDTTDDLTGGETR
jgi:hypothetical protein